MGLPRQAPQRRTDRGSRTIHAAVLDPESSRHLDLLANCDFSKTMNPNNFIDWGNCRSVDGAAAPVVPVTGPADTTVNALRSTGSGYAYQAHAHAIGRGWAGQLFMVDAWVRSSSGNGEWRLRVETPTLDAAEGVVLTGDATTSCTRVRRVFAVPPTRDDLALFVGADTGSRVEWTDVHVYVYVA